jgi:hypothetical protein
MQASARRRLRVVASHTTIPPAASTASQHRQQQIVASRPAAAAAADPAGPRLLTDAEMVQFVAQGHITLPVAEYEQSFHAAIHARAEQLFTTQLNYGNTRNIYPVLPELEQIMHGPTVAGALTSTLGEDYVMDRRKHMHNSSSQGDQRFHKDCQRGKSLTGHMPRCCMIFYVPAGADAPFCSAIFCWKSIFYQGRLWTTTRKR